MTEAKFTIEKVANMIFCTSGCGLVWYAWNEEEFTRRKLNNAIAKIKAGFNGAVVFVFNGV